MTRPRTWSCAPARPATSAQWQRRLAETLGGILATHEDLAPIAWSIGAQGCTLLGLIDGHAPSMGRYTAERTYAEWQAALGLQVIGHEPGVLRAARTRPDGVRVLLVALLPDPPAEGLTHASV
ncbi:hypothetical protein HD597_010051 [Nonomuraea thailandensis]|uniref:Uncharacterized protein n=1 Tax=Nonomuraea thailandensis TaxID=1188745 RepID=A0A9X2GWH2_9ACTN|nr:hypothetical protein [Nonomuraea thailandensis]MCP2363031.1 hypothetical protein [Nonomuraea thailandensis]